jgi:hypothetical protein
MPLNFKQDGATVQVPVTSPPHGVTFVVSEQDDPPPLPELPPALAPPLPTAPPLPEEPPDLVAELPPVVELPPDVELPPVPDGVPELELHAPETIPNAIAIARTDWTFIERLLEKGKPLAVSRGIGKRLYINYSPVAAHGKTGSS